MAENEQREEERRERQRRQEQDAQRFRFGQGQNQGQDFEVGQIEAAQEETARGEQAQRQRPGSDQEPQGGATEFGPGRIEAATDPAQSAGSRRQDTEFGAELGSTFRPRRPGRDEADAFDRFRRRMRGGDQGKQEK